MVGNFDHCCQSPNSGSLCSFWRFTTGCYCMRDVLEKVPEGDWWMCEDCKKSECKKSNSQVNLESSSSAGLNSAELNSKSSHDWKRQTGVISRSYSSANPSANRHGVQSEAQSLKDKMSAKSCDNTPLQHKDSSYKTFKKGKAKETKDTTSELQIYCNPQDKAKASHVFSDKRCADTLQVDLDRKTKALETSAGLPYTSKTTKKRSLLVRGSLSENLRNANVEKSSCVSLENPKLHSYSGSPHSISGLSEIADVKFGGYLDEARYLPMKKRKIRDFVSSSALDLNVNTHGGTNNVGAQDIPEAGAVDTSFSGDKIEAHEIGESNLVIDLNTSLWPESATPEVVGPCLPVENVDDQPSKDVNVTMRTEETKNEENLNNNNAERSNTDRPESLASPTSDEEHLGLLYWQAVEVLSSNFGL
ncbi:hypothetical protein DEO72_LG2g1913 [Vigna unguiculata]|uniref:Uncharacterized protein n=1 Tax=Vigna unguiculata TaxID=3917 RepID=A0A4D6L0W3_VIGUN|nr:hypothetical protein DEO72_LG2g1913 [Vigna unguiculata]